MCLNAFYLHFIILYNTTGMSHLNLQKFVLHGNTKDGLDVDICREINAPSQNF